MWHGFRVFRSRIEKRNGAFQLHRIEGYRSCQFPGCPNTESSTSSPVACITGYENLVITQVRVIDRCQTFVTDHQGFNRVKSTLVCVSPSWEFAPTFFCSQWSQHAGKIREFRQVPRNVPDQTKERADVCRVTWDRPV